MQMANQISGGVKTLLFIGHNPIAANSALRGYIKPPILGLEHVLWHHPLIDVIYVDEYNTSKNCSRCNTNKVVIRRNTRNVYCAQCPGHRDFFWPEPRMYRTKFDTEKWFTNPDPIDEPMVRSISMDRDVNGARNIKMLGLCKVTGHTIPLAYVRPPLPWMRAPAPAPAAVAAPAADL